MVVIGVTDEAPAVVEEWLAKRKPEHPIVILKDRSFESALGVRGFPTVAVLDPEGKLSWIGHFGYEEALEQAAREAERSELWPSKELGRVLGPLREGDVGKAWGALVDLQEKGDAEVAPWVERLRGDMLGAAARAQVRARELAGQGLVFQARSLVEPYAKSRDPFPDAEAYAAFLAELEARPDYKKELKASEQYQEAVALRDGQEYTESAQAFATIARKYDELAVGALAATEARKLIDAGLPGYRSTCPSCRERRRSCDKHDESGKVRL